MKDPPPKRKNGGENLGRLIALAESLRVARNLRLSFLCLNQQQHTVANQELGIQSCYQETRNHTGLPLALASHRSSMQTLRRQYGTPTGLIPYIRALYFKYVEGMVLMNRARCFTALSRNHFSIGILVAAY